MFVCTYNWFKYFLFVYKCSDWSGQCLQLSLTWGQLAPAGSGEGWKPLPHCHTQYVCMGKLFLADTQYLYIERIFYRRFEKAFFFHQQILGKLKIWKFYVLFFRYYWLRLLISTLWIFLKKNLWYFRQSNGMKMERCHF